MDCYVDIIMPMPLDYKHAHVHSFKNDHVKHCRGLTSRRVNNIGRVTGRITGRVAGSVVGRFMSRVSGRVTDSTAGKVSVRVTCRRAAGSDG